MGNMERLLHCRPDWYGTGPTCYNLKNGKIVPGGISYSYLFSPTTSRQCIVHVPVRFESNIRSRIVSLITLNQRLSHFSVLEGPYMYASSLGEPSFTPLLANVSFDERYVFLFTQLQHASEFLISRRIYSTTLVIR